MVTLLKTEKAASSSYGMSAKLPPFHYLSWEELETMRATLAYSIDADAGRDEDAPMDTDEAVESFFLQLVSYLDIAEAKLAKRGSQLSIYLQTDIILRLNKSSEEAIGLHLKSSATGNKDYEKKYQRVFLYDKQGNRCEYPAPASVWADVPNVNSWELLVFLTNKLGIPVSIETKTLVERFALLKRSVKGNKVEIDSPLLKILKFTTDEIYKLSFLKLLKVVGGTLIF